ncbi:MAG: NAD-dependent epimerase/dehydratase family protein [Thermoanaerobaculia bacterium]
MARPVSLVTGGAGFIGSHLVDELIAMGHEVVALDDLSGGLRENVNGAAHFVEGSCTDAPLVGRIFEEHGFDFVYHLAAYAAEGLSHFIRRFNYTNNVIGSVNIINASVNHGVRCLVFTSSIAVYGAGQTPMSESLVPMPEDPYGIGKYAIELDLAAARKMFGLEYVVFRPHNVYGPRQNTGDRYRNVIGIFMNQMLAGKPLTIFGDGTQSRAFTDVSDVVPTMARSAENPDAFGEVFNIGSERVYSVNELAELVQQAAGRSAEVSHLTARNEVLHAFSDHTKAARRLGYAPTVHLRDGLARMFAAVREVGPRESPPFRGIEIERNLPQSWRDYVG